MKKLLGFTLIELMVVIAIVAVLTTLAAPSFKKMIQSTTISGAVNSFLTDMRYARSEAIRRGGGVVMCRSNSPEAANPTCGTGDGTDFNGDGVGDGWVSGWIIFEDLNKDGTKNTVDPVLRVQGRLTSLDTAPKGGSSTIFKFTATGRLQSLSGGATSLTFGGAKFAVEQQRVVCINVGGRARIALDQEGKATGNAECE